MPEFECDFNTEFAGEVTAAQVPHIAPQLLPQLLAIFGAEKVLNIVYFPVYIDANRTNVNRTEIFDQEGVQYRFLQFL